jgi:hypothetical protein
MSSSVGDIERCCLRSLGWPFNSRRVGDPQYLALEGSAVQPLYPAGPRLRDFRQDARAFLASLSHVALCLRWVP